MKDKIITGLLNLIKIKSIVTLILTVIFGILALRESINAEQFIPIFTTIVGFYFGTQKVKETTEDTTDTVEDNKVPADVWED